MNLTITGHHVEVTPAIREFVTNKLDKVVRHFDGVTSVAVILSVEKLRQKAEVTVHVRGKDIFVEAEDQDMYAAIDALIEFEEMSNVALPADIVMTPDIGAPHGPNVPFCTFSV